MTRIGTRAGAALFAAATCAAAPRAATAAATFVIQNLDPAGVGFNDPTPAAPVGGNQGTTVGLQRQIAFQFAADIWGQALDSVVPIVVEAHFAPLTCASGLITLGHARSQTVVASVPPDKIIPGLPPNMLFPQPLADRLAGVDLDPGVADLVATFNGGLHDCDPNVDWYYGLDGGAGSLADLVEVVVHELGHGLGFATAVDLQTGAFNIGIPDAFSAHVFDNGVNLSWLDMTDAQRVASIKNIRHLVWAGENVRRLTTSVLDRGTPLLTVEPGLPGLDGSLGESNFGPRVAALTVTGPLVVGNPIAGCGPLPIATGGIFLLAGGSSCSPLNQTEHAARAGATAVLLADANGNAPPSSLELPADQLQVIAVNIPVVTLARSDGQLLIDNQARALSISLDSNADRLVGADEDGRPYLYASDPVRPGSTVSHWDPLARPDLIEEPESGYEHPHGIVLEAALLRDIGWVSFCGNGQLDEREACDDGPANSDTAADACRTTCVLARCGDGVKDHAEACDYGPHNGETGVACAADCAIPPAPPIADASSGCACAVGRSRARGELPALLLLAGLALIAAARARRRA